MNRIRGDKYQGKLAVGQRVYCLLYGGMDGVITAIHGEQQPGTIKNLGGVVFGGRASIDVAFNDHISKMVPEGIIRGVQWEISNVIELPEAINETIAKAQAAKAEADRQRKEEKERQNQEAAALPAKYPYLTPGNKNGAKNIRIELKRTFPTIKFSVTTTRGTIRIAWNDGPTVEQVKKITDKYQEGNFDGMTDSYNYDHSNVWPDVFGGARYVFENRHESPELILKAAENLGYKLESGQWDNYGNLPGLDWNTSQMIYRESRGMTA